MTKNETVSGTSPWRARAAVLTLGTFAVGTDGFVIVGLLPQIQKTLQVSTAAAGQLVSVFAIAYALLGPVFAALTGRWSKRRVLVTGIALLAAGNAVTASAHVYGLVLASRVLAGSGAALFVASAVATAAHLAGEQRRGKAIAMVTAGATLSLVLGAPLGTLIGGAWGWQMAIWFVAAVAVGVAVVIAVLLPPIRLDQGATLRQRIAPLTDQRVLRVLVVTLLTFIGIFLPFTYMSAVFAPAIGGEQARLALLLLVFGVAATAGNLTAGSLTDRYGSRRVVIGAAMGVAAVCVVMLAVQQVFILVAIAQALSGVVSYSVMGPQQHRIIAYAAPESASLVTSLNTSAGYLGNFLASSIGAAILTITGSAAPLLLIAAAFAAFAAFLAWWLSRSTGERGGEAVDETGEPTTTPPEQAPSTR
ncbi:MFS transporter [Streptosporangium sp. NBC_01639]|uniref:MFS transporter n=1 Tax=Streptosporangium sp. NBC_01639 TaxID=2975948 RepID=UPI00386E404D|nr:MFS transporter [Streptosporangium sp. NBC_01639]